MEHPLVVGLEDIANGAQDMNCFEIVCACLKGMESLSSASVHCAADVFLHQFMTGIRQTQMMEVRREKLENAIAEHAREVEDRQYWIEVSEESVEELRSELAERQVCATDAKDKLVTAKMQLLSALGSLSLNWADVVSKLKKEVQAYSEAHESDMEYASHHRIQDRWLRWDEELIYAPDQVSTFSDICQKITSASLSDSEFESIMQTLQHLGSKTVQSPFQRQALFPRLDVKATSTLRREVFEGVTRKGCKLSPYAEVKLDLAHELNMKDFERSMPEPRGNTQGANKKGKRPFAGFTLEDVAEIYRDMVNGSRKRELARFEASLEAKAEQKAKRQRVARQATAEKNPLKKARLDYLELKTAVLSFKAAHPDIPVDMTTFEKTEASLRLENYITLNDHLADLMGKIQEASSELADDGNIKDDSKSMDEGDSNSEGDASYQSSSAVSGTDSDSD